SAPDSTAGHRSQYPCGSLSPVPPEGCTDHSDGDTPPSAAFAPPWPEPERRGHSGPQSHIPLPPPEPSWLCPWSVPLFSPPLSASAAQAAADPRWPSGRYHADVPPQLFSDYRYQL